MYLNTCGYKQIYKQNSYIFFSLYHITCVFQTLLFCFRQIASMFYSDRDFNLYLLYD